MKEKNKKLISEVLSDIRRDMTDEEVLALLADTKLSENPAKEKYTIGQRAADRIAKFVGSWAFIFTFTGLLLLWMIVNVLLYCWRRARSTRIRSFCSTWFCPASRPFRCH